MGHRIRMLADSPHFATMRQGIAGQRIVEDAIAIQQIPAPTFHEADRASLVKNLFEQIPLHDVFADEVFNVFGRWPGTSGFDPSLLVSAHLDTVFPTGTDLTYRHDSERVHGPGIGDNSLGVAALIALARLCQQHQLRPPADIWFVANSREEGLGNLDGIRAAWHRLGHRLGAAIVIEGMALGRIYHAGIAVRRLHITCTAPGGHSWLHFGQPNAIHGLVELGSKITKLEPPDQPRTTFNIGLIKGGHSVNSLAAEADLYLDLRSENPASLANLERQILAAVETTRQPNLEFDIKVVGDRPAGRIDTSHPLVQLAAEALCAVDQQCFFENGSTDANVLLAEGLPTVTVGVSHGKHAHRLDEFIEIGPVADGIWHLLLLTFAAANELHTWHSG
jgi:tripeptide aminopeptidase